MADVATVMKFPADLPLRQRPNLFIFHEQYKHEVAFDVHRKVPYLTACCERHEKESLTEGSAELEIYRSLTD